MQELIKQEQFELEILDLLNSRRLLNNLIFCGGTMLRLCYGLNRFSADLDFWVAEDIDTAKLFREIKKALSGEYAVKDAARKFHTLLFEIRSGRYPRSLKIEIRKEKKKIKAEQAIAYSKHANTQVFIRAISPEDMMRAKIEALLARREIRDAFDLEFLLKKGVSLDAPDAILKPLLKIIGAFGPRDYTVKLGSLLEAQERKYYAAQNFKILKSAIQERLQASLRAKK